MEFLKGLWAKLKASPGNTIAVVGIVVAALTILYVVRWVVPAKEKTISEKNTKITELSQAVTTVSTDRDRWKQESESLRKSLDKKKVKRPYVGPDGKVVFGPDGKPVMIEESASSLLLAKDKFSQETEKENTRLRGENNTLTEENTKLKLTNTKSRGTGITAFYFRDLQGDQGGDVNFPVLGPAEAGVGIGLFGTEFRIMGRVGVKLDDLHIF